MLDYRLYTFLQLCETMNYRVTAELLGMTQPAVTQHIHYLENTYRCKLFLYDGKRLKKTKEALILEEYARSARYNEDVLVKKMQSQPIRTIRIGATKTIGEFVIRPKVKQFLKKDKVSVSLMIDNTSNLLHELECNQLDFALVEGYFDKVRYGYSLYQKASFVGICPKEHPFAHKQISIEEIFQETIIIREQGSGTRAILEQVLMEHNFSLSSFEQLITISDFQLIKELVAENEGITFAYEVIADGDDQLATFTLLDQPIVREFNYVYLKNTEAIKDIELFEQV